MFLLLTSLFSPFSFSTTQQYFQSAAVEVSDVVGQEPLYVDPQKFPFTSGQASCLDEAYIDILNRSEYEQVVDVMSRQIGEIDAFGDQRLGQVEQARERIGKSWSSSVDRAKDYFIMGAEGEQATIYDIQRDRATTPAEACQLDNIIINGKLSFAAQVGTTRFCSGQGCDGGTSGANLLPGLTQGSTLVDQLSKAIDKNDTATRDYSAFMTMVLTNPALASAVQRELDITEQQLGEFTPDQLKGVSPAAVKEIIRIFAVDSVSGTLVEVAKNTNPGNIIKSKQVQVSLTKGADADYFLIPDSLFSYITYLRKYAGVDRGYDIIMFMSMFAGGLNLAKGRAISKTEDLGQAAATVAKAKALSGKGFVERFRLLRKGGEGFEGVSKKAAFAEALTAPRAYRGKYAVDAAESRILGSRAAELPDKLKKFSGTLEDYNKGASRFTSEYSSLNKKIVDLENEARRAVQSGDTVTGQAKYAQAASTRTQVDGLVEGRIKEVEALNGEISEVQKVTSELKALSEADTAKGLVGKTKFNDAIVAQGDALSSTNKALSTDLNNLRIMRSNIGKTAGGDTVTQTVQAAKKAEATVIKNSAEAKAAADTLQAEAFRLDEVAKTASGAEDQARQALVSAEREVADKTREVNAAGDRVDLAEHTGAPSEVKEAAAAEFAQARKALEEANGAVSAAQKSADDAVDAARDASAKVANAKRAASEAVIGAKSQADKIAEASAKVREAEALLGQPMPPVPLTPPSAYSTVIESVSKSADDFEKVVLKPNFQDSVAMSKLATKIEGTGFLGKLARSGPYLRSLLYGQSAVTRLAAKLFFLGTRAEVFSMAALHTYNSNIREPYFTVDGLVLTVNKAMAKAVEDSKHPQDLKITNQVWTEIQGKDIKKSALATIAGISTESEGGLLSKFILTSQQVFGGERLPKEVGEKLERLGNLVMVYQDQQGVSGERNTNYIGESTQPDETGTRSGFNVLISSRLSGTSSFYEEPENFLYRNNSAITQLWMHSENAEITGYSQIGENWVTQRIDTITQSAHTFGSLLFAGSMVAAPIGAVMAVKAPAAIILTYLLFEGTTAVPGGEKITVGNEEIASRKGPVTALALPLFDEALENWGAVPIVPSTKIIDLFSNSLAPEDRTPAEPPFCQSIVSGIKNDARNLRILKYITGAVSIGANIANPLAGVAFDIVNFYVAHKAVQQEQEALLALGSCQETIFEVGAHQVVPQPQQLTDDFNSIMSEALEAGDIDAALAGLLPEGGTSVAEAAQFAPQLLHAVAAMQRPEPNEEGNTINVNPPSMYKVHFQDADLRWFNGGACSLQYCSEDPRTGAYKCANNQGYLLYTIVPETGDVIPVFEGPQSLLHVNIDEGYTGMAQKVLTVKKKPTLEPEDKAFVSLYLGDPQKQAVYRPGCVEQTALQVISAQGHSQESFARNKMSDSMGIFDIAKTNEALVWNDANVIKVRITSQLGHQGRAFSQISEFADAHIEIFNDESITLKIVNNSRDNEELMSFTLGGINKQNNGVSFKKAGGSAAIIRPGFSQQTSDGRLLTYDEVIHVFIFDKTTLQRDDIKSYNVDSAATREFCRNDKGQITGIKINVDLNSLPLEEELVDGHFGEICYDLFTDLDGEQSGIRDGEYQGKGYDGEQHAYKILDEDGPTGCLMMLDTVTNEKICMRTEKDPTTGMPQFVFYDSSGDKRLGSPLSLLSLAGLGGSMMYDPATGKIDLRNEIPFNMNNNFQVYGAGGLGLMTPQLPPWGGRADFAAGRAPPSEFDISKVQRPEALIASLPSVPESQPLMLMFLAAIVLAMAFIRTNSQKPRAGTKGPRRVTRSPGMSARKRTKKR